MKVAFVVGHEDSHESPSDTPEAYWRVLVPARKFGSAHILGRADASRRALEADVVWIHQPTCYAAAELAERACTKGKPVVLDFSEDLWTRDEVDHAYSDARLDACRQALEAASCVVCAGEGLVPAYAAWGNVRVVPPTIPLGTEWSPAPPKSPARLAWWSDGRQKRGMEDVAAGLINVLEETDCSIDHIQFSHHLPLMRGLKTHDERAARAARLTAYFENDRDLSAEGNLKVFRDAMRTATLHLECYPQSTYAGTVSDLPLLRSAALGIPTITTRSGAPPGALAVDPGDWGPTILEVLEDPGRRQGLSVSARDWARSRSTFLPYEAVLKEVTS